MFMSLTEIYLISGALKGFKKKKKEIKREIIPFDTTTCIHIFLCSLPCQQFADPRVRQPATLLLDSTSPASPSVISRKHPDGRLL